MTNLPTMNFWKRIRLLVADGCNYSCPFYHNEGQGRSIANRTMTMALFSRVIGAVRNRELADICISGGEPFLNRHVVDMLLFACDETDADISCASNLSLITDDQIGRLAHSRVKFNIQFPYADTELFRRSTASGDFHKVSERVDRMIDAGIKVGLNTVVQADTIENIENILAYAAKRSIPLKLLPEIGRPGSRNCKVELERVWAGRILERHDKGTGAVKWVVDSGESPVHVVFVDTPCISGEFPQCHRYGELRVWPGGELQPCILRTPAGSVSECDSSDEISEKLASLWKNFKSC